MAQLQSTSVTGTLTTTSDVGIGTASPVYDLDVVGSGDRTLRLKSTSGANGVVYFEGTSRNWGIFGGSNNSNLTFKDESGNIDVITLRAGGNVGIGITNPGSKLEVADVTTYDAGIKISGNTVNGVGLGINNANGNNWYLISTGTNNGGGANNLGFYNSTQGEYRVYFKGDGNVGINTTAPNNKLQVVGGVTATSFTGSFKGSLDGNANTATTADFADTANEATTADTATSFNGLIFNGVSTRFTGDLNTLGLSSTSGIYNIGAGYTNGPGANLYGTLFGIWNTDISVQFWATYNGDFYWRKSNASTYAGSTWRTILDTVNYNSYVPTLTGTGASGTWSIGISGNAATATTATTATNVAWSGVSAGYRENYDLGFRPADNSSSYSGFRFGTPGNDEDAGYLLIRGGADVNVYTQNGITLVADAGWLTLAQRTQSDKGIQFMTGATSTTKMTITNGGIVQVKQYMEIGSGINATQYTVLSENQLYRTSGILYINNSGAGNISMAGGGGNVGIGSATPAYKLDVAGSARLTAGGTGAAYLYFHDTTTYKYLAYFNDDAYWRSPNRHFIEGLSGFKGVWDASGNLGVNTTAPTARLQVIGPADSTYDSTVIIEGSGTYPSTLTGIVLNAPANTQSHLRFSEGGSPKVQLRYNVGSAQDNKLKVYSWTVGRDIFTWDTTNGYVGINTSSPSYALDISGNTNNDSFRIFSSNAAGPAVAIQNTSTGGKNWQLISNGTSNADGAGRFQFWNSTDSFTAITVGYASVIDTTMYTPLTVNSTGKFYSAVGAGDDVRTGLAHYDTTAQAAGVGGQLVLGYKYLNDGTYTEGAILKTYKENSVSGQYGSGLRFQVRNTGPGLSTKMTLDPSGNLGIGNTNPTVARLVVTTAGAQFNTKAEKGVNMTGTAVVATTNENTMTGIWFATGEDPNGTHWSGIVGSRSNYLSDWATHLSFFTHYPSQDNLNAAFEVMRIAGTGNVGIGTSNPTRRLDVHEGNIQIVANFQNTSSTSARIKFTDANTGAENVNIGAIGTRMAMWTNNTERMSIVSGGYVGIGTANPISPFHVYTAQTEVVRIQGDAAGVNGIFRIQIDEVNDSFGTGARTFLGDGGTDIIIGTSNSSYTPGNSYIALNHGGNIYMGAGASPGLDVTINTDGNLGIGTTGPAAKLHVNGTLRVDSSTSFTRTYAATPNTIIGNKEDEQCLGTPDGWLAINVNGTECAVPLYTTG